MNCSSGSAASRPSTADCRCDTTLDQRLQQLATKAIGNWLGKPGDPAAAIVAMTPGTGAIRAMAVNAPGHPAWRFNLASQSRRQAGSTFKLFTLTAAMEDGIRSTRCGTGRRR